MRRSSGQKTGAGWTAETETRDAREAGGDACDGRMGDAAAVVMGKGGGGGEEMEQFSKHDACTIAYHSPPQHNPDDSTHTGRLRRRCFLLDTLPAVVLAR